MTSREIQRIVWRGVRGSLGFAVVMVIVKALVFRDYSLRIIAVVALFLGVLDALWAYLKIRGRDKVSPVVALFLGLIGIAFWTSVAWSARSEATSPADWIPFVVLLAAPVYLFVVGCVGVANRRHSFGEPDGT